LAASDATDRGAQQQRAAATRRHADAERAGR